MKKLLMLLAIVPLLLTSCTSSPAAPYYNAALTNSAHVCGIGDTVYYSSFGAKPLAFNCKSDKILRLCRDPLCDHEGNDSLCPENEALWTYDIKTDGRRLFLSTWNQFAPTDENGGMTGTIFALDTADMTMSELATRRFTSSAAFNIMCDGDYVYYTESFYIDAGDRADSGTDDQYLRLMRVKTTGGIPEDALDRDFPVNSVFFVDGENYYVTSLFTPEVSVISRKTEAESEITVPDALGVLYAVSVGGETYFVCKSEYVTLTYECKNTFAKLSVYRYDGGAFTLLADGLADAAFTYDRLYCADFNPTYYGTREMPTGKGSETEPMDFISTSDGGFYAIDLTSGERVGEWRYTDGQLFICGASGDTLIVRRSDTMRAYYEQNERFEPYWAAAALNDDGTTVIVISY